MFLLVRLGFWEATWSVPAINPANPFIMFKSPVTATCPDASLSLDTEKESLP